MRAIAKGHRMRMFAGAPGDRLSLGDFYFLRSQAGARMRAIAEGLAVRAAARTLPIRAGVDLLNNGKFLEDDWIAHK